MKRSRKIRSTTRDENLAAQALNSLKHPSAPSDNQLRAIPDMDTPRSLKTGAGRQYWDEVVRLLVKIRTDCDAAAERLGYASNEENGLAAVEYIARKTLEAVQGERQQQIVSAEKGSLAPVRSPQLPRQSSTEPGNNSKKRAQPTGHSERSKLIDELKQMLRDGKTKSGAVIDPQLAHVIAKQITTLNEEIAQPETTESIKRMRESIAGFYGKAYGNRQKAFKPPAVAVAKKRNRTKRASSHAKKNTTTRKARGRSR